MKNQNYYMIITTILDFSYDIKNNFKFIGFPNRNEASIKKFKKGDKVVFYVTKQSCFAAIVEVTGEYFYDSKQIWSDEYDVYPHRIETKPLYVIEDFDKRIFIKEIWDNLSFIKTKHKWGSQVQGSFRKLAKEDFQIIEKAIKNEVKK